MAAETCEWKIHEDYPGYLVNKNGTIYSRFYKRNLRQRLQGGYLVVSMKRRNAKKQRSVYVHRLVAECHVPNIDGKPRVHHIDHNRANPHYTNLQWVTSSENTQLAVKEGRMGAKNVNREPVRQLFLNGDFCADYESSLAAAKAIGGHSSSIIAACRGKLRGAHGYRWKYINKRNTPPEDARVIPGFSRYLATKGGIIYNTKTNRYLRSVVGAYGYCNVGVCADQETELWPQLVHRLVALAFYGLPPATMTYVNHKNNIRADNRPENLEYITPAGNRRHGIRVKRAESSTNLENSPINTVDYSEIAPQDAIPSLDYPFLLITSQGGLVYDTRHNHYLTKRKAPFGYHVVIYSLPINGDNKTVQVAQLVMRAFRPLNRNGRYPVQHMDGNVYNDDLDNLQWGRSSWKRKREDSKIDDEPPAKRQGSDLSTFYIDLYVQDPITYAVKNFYHGLYLK